MLPGTRAVETVVELIDLASFPAGADDQVSTRGSEGMAFARRITVAQRLSELTLKAPRQLLSLMRGEPT